MADHRSYEHILSMFLNDLSYIHLYSSLSTGILRMLPAPSGLIAQSIEHCTGTAEVMAWNRVQS